MNSLIIEGTVSNKNNDGFILLNVRRNKVSHISVKYTRPIPASFLSITDGNEIRIVGRLEGNNTNYVVPEHIEIVRR